MKHYLNTKKLAKLFVLTGVLSVGIMAGGHFTAAAGLDKANPGPVKAVQANSSQDVNGDVEVSPAIPTRPNVSDNHQKTKGGMGKSQASIHASETAKLHAALNSAVFSKTLAAELNNSTADTGYTFGSDSSTSTNPNGEDLYLGELGSGNIVRFDASTGGGSYFSSAGAHNANYVYGYWFLAGMQKAPTGTSASNWGAQQAQIALDTYKAMKSVYGSKVRPVIFIDVESTPSGMNDYDYANNQSVYNAFVNYLNQSEQGVKPGTYTSPGNWNAAMENFSPSTPGAYWVADWPGNIPSDLTTSNPNWINFPGTNEKAEIWQYYGGNVDYDVAWKLP